MLRTLLTLLNDADLQCRARKAYNEVVKPFINFGSSFEEEGNSYILVDNLPDGFTGENVNVEVDEDENTITVDVAYKTENSSFRRTFTETLPTDADLGTLTARVDNSVLTVVVDKLPEPEPEPESKPETNSVDPTHVEIKRKRK